MENDDNKIMTQPEKIDYILSGVARYFGIAKDELCSPYENDKKKELWIQKRYAIVLLQDFTGLSWRGTGKLLGYAEDSGHCIAKHHYNNMKDELSEEMYGSQKTKMIYNELLSYLKLNSYEKQESLQAKKTRA